MTTEKTKESGSPQKEALRRQMHGFLDSIPPKQASEWSESLCQQVLELPEVANAESVLTCLSFGGEPDTWGLVGQLVALNRRVYVPRVEAGDSQLHIHSYPCDLRMLSFGLRQPVPEAPEVAPTAIDREIDVVLVLGLSFGRNGYRLGHGGGYFDRFLSRHRLPAVGMAYDLQLVGRVPRESHDIPMSVIVTERGPVRPDDDSGNREEHHK